jgi:hypothetical protein
MEKGVKCPYYAFARQFATKGRRGDKKWPKLFRLSEKSLELTGIEPVTS